MDGNPYIYNCIWILRIEVYIYIPKQKQDGTYFIHIWVCLHCLHTSNIRVRLAPFQHATHSLVWIICLHFQIAMLYVQPFYQVLVYSIQVSCFRTPLPSLSPLYSIDGIPSSWVGAYPRNQVDKSPPTPIRLQQFRKKIGHQSNQKNL